MTYDDWKTESPEDERLRLNGTDVLEDEDDLEDDDEDDDDEDDDEDEE